MPPIVLTFAVSTMRSKRPECSTVKPAESSAPRNSRYASSGVISSGATTVTFLLLAGIVPGSRNCLQVIEEIQAIRSPSSVSGFRFSFTMRLPAGNFLQVLKSLSPISWFEPVTPAAAPPPGVAGVAVVPAAGAAPVVGAGGRVRFPPSTPGSPGSPGDRAPPGGVAPGAGGGFDAPDSPGLTLTGFPSGPVTTAARSGLPPRKRTATATATCRFVCLVIG